MAYLFLGLAALLAANAFTATALPAIVVVADALVIATLVTVAAWLADRRAA